MANWAKISAAATSDAKKVAELNKLAKAGKAVKVPATEFGLGTSGDVARYNLLKETGLVKNPVDFGNLSRIELNARLEKAKGIKQKAALEAKRNNPSLKLEGADDPESIFFMEHVQPKRYGEPSSFMDLSTFIGPKEMINW